MKHINGQILMIAIAMVFLPIAVQAVPIALGTPPGRVATLDSATSGTTGTGNATAATLNGINFGGLAPWTERGESTSAGNSGVFAVSLTSGAWGSGAAAGTWAITDLSFWTTYDDVAISMHVGNGGGDPDHFIWQVEEGELSGTWSYTRGNTGGGGLSNLKLYSSGIGDPGDPGDPGTSVPDGGTTLTLLGLSLLGLACLRRRILSDGNSQASDTA